MTLIDGERELRQEIELRIREDNDEKERDEIDRITH